MPIVSITNLDDRRLAIYRHLKATNATRARDWFVVEGEKLVERLIQSPFPLVSILVTDRHASTIADWVGAEAETEVPVYVVPEALIHDLIGYHFHQGALACGRRRPWPDLIEIVARSGDPQTLLVAPRIDNPENLGVLIRLGDVFGVNALLVGPRCPDPLSRRVLRVSMGSALRVPVLALPNLAEVLERLRSTHGFELMATVTDPDAEPLDTYRSPDRLAVLFGCEGTGLDADWVARCEHRVTIPMRPGAESLNVSVAAGIVLHHVTTGPGANR